MNEERSRNPRCVVRRVRTAGGCRHRLAAARRRLGPKFDLKRCHQLVLDMGAMGLDQLGAELDAIGSTDGDGIT